MGKRRAQCGAFLFTFFVALMGLALLAAAVAGLYGKFGPRDDNVSGRERAERLRLFRLIRQIELQPVDTREYDRAFELMNLTPVEREELTKELGAAKAEGAPAKRQLLWITLWDSDAEDGDVVSLQSGSYRAPFTLKNKPQQFPVLLAPDGILHFVGAGDGDGRGVTVGALSGRTAISLPVLAVDERVWVRVERR
jgi:hypothetical protein